MSPKIPTDAELLKSYGPGKTLVNGFTLSGYLDAEAMFCEATEDRRMDLEARARWLVQQIPPGEILSEHRFLVEES